MPFIPCIPGNMPERHIVVLTGAGISAESGIRTFRDSGGLWEDHDIREVASPEGWQRNPELVHRFYNARREQLRHVSPNPAHFALAQLEQAFRVTIITQNVDDLHERAGSRQVIHLHGELRKARSTGDPRLIYPWNGPLDVRDVCEKGFPLRPHIIWFGESVPLMKEAEEHVRQADVLLVIGTSLGVYPAAGLLLFCPRKASVFYVDPHPAEWPGPTRNRLSVLKEKASTGVTRLVRHWMATGDFGRPPED